MVFICQISNVSLWGLYCCNSHYCTIHFYTRKATKYLFSIFSDVKTKAVNFHFVYEILFMLLLFSVICNDIPCCFYLFSSECLDIFYFLLTLKIKKIPPEKLFDYANRQRHLQQGEAIQEHPLSVLSQRERIIQT